MSSGISLKLKLNTSNNQPITSPSPTTTPGSARPRLKLTNSLPASPVQSQEPPKAKKVKVGRTSKPSAKVLENRKRLKEESDTEEESTINVLPPPSKRVKIQVGTNKPSGTTPTSAKTPITPALVFKQKGKPPKRNPGEGYDSEASDRELDPVIEEQFIIRVMANNEDCEYLRQMIAEKKIGTTRDIHMKFLDPEGRRAIVTIRKNTYAATMVDLPCILEAMKSWDKRGWWKSADVSQMLLVYKQIQSESEALLLPLPAMVDPVTHHFPHGLTPPMQYARKRRFRKRLHKTQIEAMEEAVEKLLKADEKAISTSYEIIDPEAEFRRASQAFSPVSSQAGNDYGDQYSGEEDAEGEIDEPIYYDQMLGHGVDKVDVPDEEVDLDLEAELEAAMDEEFEHMATPSNIGATPQTNGDAGAEEEDSGDESLDGDDFERNGEGLAEEIADDENERQMQEAAVRDDIVDLEDRIAANIAAQATQSNPILRKRLEEGARKLKAELQLKKSSIGEEEENE